ncbi:MAG: glutathione S-transferase family protein [Proteobacteria bacterium]|nr:glutathione S-transferase family protein [Pseudomonadota bacterium]
MSLGWIALVAAVAAASWALWEGRQRRTHAMPGGLCADIALPHQAEFELYHNALSLCSKKTRLCLAELGIEYRAHHVHLIETGAYETLGRDFLRVNPAGTVPVLVHRGHPVYESHEQIRYAAEHAPASAPSLVPEDPAARAEMQVWVDRASTVGDDPIANARESAGNAAPGLTVPLFAAMIDDIAVRRILEGLLFHRLKIRPLLFLLLKATGLHRLHRNGRVVAVIGRCGRAMHRHLDALEEQLEKTGGPWILGDGFTLADVSWAVILERLREGDSLHVFTGGGARPGVTAYWERLQARPSYRAAIVDHGHPTIERGIRRLRAAKDADPALRAALEEF